jgi:hypothetical protein
MRTLTMRMMRRRRKMTVMEEMSPHPCCCATPFCYATCSCPKDIVIDEVEEDPMEMVLEQEVPEAHEVILADEEPELPKPCFNNLLMRDYEESPSRMMDDPHELDDLTKANYDLDEWYPEDGSNDRD